MSDSGTAAEALDAIIASNGGGEAAGGAETASAPPAAEPAAHTIDGNADTGIHTPADLMDTDTAGIKSFDADYVSRLRAEAAKYRTEARDAKGQIETMQQRYSAFDGYEQADLEVWQNLATSWQTDPRAAAETMRTIAVNVLGDPTASAEEKAEAAQVMEQTAQAQSPEDVQKIIDDRLAQHEQQQQMQARVSAIESQLAEAGYAKGTAQYANVLWYATNDKSTGGDIGKAIEMQKAYEQSIVDQYVSSVRDGKTPVRGPATPGVPAAEAPQQPTDVKSATAAARAFLEGRR